MGENEDFLAFLDINPLAKGHTLVIPKKHVRWTYDVDNFGAYWEFARHISRGIEKALAPRWIQFITYGLIPHAHIHIIPRYTEIEKSEFCPSMKILSFTKEEMEKIAGKV